MLTVQSIKIKQNYKIQDIRNNKQNTDFQLFPKQKFIPNNDVHTNFNKNFLQMPLTISFLGQTVHIVDAGAHADYMLHFANAINNNIDVKMHYTEENKNYKGTKQLKSLEHELELLEKSKNSFKNEYIAIPALASVGILNIEEQYNKVMNSKIILTPENIKSHKKELLSFLKKIYEYPELYKTYINNMDFPKQGIEHTYGVIDKINKLKAKGAKVYIPSGHPHDNTLKWLAGERGLKDELYHYISTGKDTSNKIAYLKKEIINNNWYDFNLLSLSDTNIVGVKSPDGITDYLFAAYDSCITDGARGVYNLAPVRDNETSKLLGYSFTDTNTIQYPYSDFPHKETTKNIEKFVGKNIKEVLASREDTLKLRKWHNNNSLKNIAPSDKIYAVNDIFTPQEIKINKLYLKGNYVDNSLTLFFDINKNQQVIFKKCNCEGSDRPSIYSMWGSCFAVLNAISRDINLESNIEPLSVQEHKSNIKKILNNAICEYQQKNNINNAVMLLNIAINMDKAYYLKNINYKRDGYPYYWLGHIAYNSNNFSLASKHLNNSINLISDKLYNEQALSLKKLKEAIAIYNKSKEETLEYENKKEKYSKGWYKLLGFKAKQPELYNVYKNETCTLAKKAYDKEIKDIAYMYLLLEQICLNNNEKEAAKICHMAAKDISAINLRGDNILKRRADGINYIGDLYNET